MTARSALAFSPGAAGPLLSLRWQDKAACRGADPDLFFPAEGQPASPARAICAACPVRPACLSDALAVEGRLGTIHVWGIRGGLSASERKQVLEGGGPKTCGNGLHEMTPDNTYTDPQGCSNCRACRHASVQRRRESGQFRRAARRARQADRGRTVAA